MKSKHKKSPTRQKLHYNRIHSFKIYTVDELAKVIGRHKLTVIAYIKAGMPVISKFPYLIKGVDAKNFLEAIVKNKKQPLEADEFYCPRCKKPAISLTDKICDMETGKILGNGVKQIIIKGVCQKCSCKLNRFSSETEWLKFLDAVTNPQPKINKKNTIVLIKTSNSSLNTQKTEKSGEVENGC